MTIFNRQKRAIKPFHRRPQGWPKPPLGLAAMKRRRRRDAIMLLTACALAAALVTMVVMSSGAP